MNSKRNIFSQVHLASAGAIFRGTNNEMTYTMMSCMQLYKELDEEQVRKECMAEKNLTGDKRKKWWEKC